LFAIKDDTMLLLILKASVAALIFAIGMTVRVEDIIYLWHRPVLMLKSVAAMYVVMPVVAILMARVLYLPERTELAIVILAICAGAPLLPKKLIKFGGDPAYVFSLIVNTSLIAVVTVPASLHLLAEVLSLDTTALTATQVARVILKTFLQPLAIGMLLRWVAPALAERIGEPLLKIAGIAMGLCAVAVLAYSFHVVFEVGLPSLLAFGAFTLAAILTGHLLGGPDPSDRTSLAVACSSRHIGLALLIAANAPGRRALELVVTYLLASAVVSIPYVLWMKRRRSQG
jgi:BASS family bile acid:Na+ symporter